MNIFTETKLSLLNKLKGYFAYNVYNISLNEQLVGDLFDSTYAAMSIIARCTDLIVNTAAEVEFIIVEDTGLLYKRAEYPRFEKLLATPDSQTSELAFRRSIYRDLYFQGNAFVYHLGDGLQILSDVEYSTNNKPSAGGQPLDENRLAHIRLLNQKHKKFGEPYITRIDSELKLIEYMLKFQKNFFSNNGFPGVILESDHPMSTRTKDKLAEEFINMFSIMKGNSSKPFVLDNSVKLKDVQKNFKDLQFRESIQNLSENVVSALGVPEVLIHGGNNANISPNLKAFIYLTIAPFVDVVASELTKLLHNFYVGTKRYKVVGNYDTVKSVKDDFLKLANSVKTLYTTGLITKNEGRLRLGYEPVEDGNEFLEPANITGSHYEGNATQDNNDDE